MSSRQKSVVKDPIEVYCRIRPLESADDLICLKAKDKNTIILFSPEGYQVNRIVKELHCGFKEVFDSDTSQKEVFDRISLPLIEDVLQGHNGLIFTYGITSSGKTYTMMGPPQDGGLLPRSLDVIFSSIKECQAPKFVFKPDKMNGFEIQSYTEARIDQQKDMKAVNRTMMKTPRRDKTILQRNPDTSVVTQLPPDVNFAVFVSYVEIYNNYIYDLLEESPIDLKRKMNLNSKMLREDVQHNMYVFGVTESEVKTVEEALDMFYKGQLRRRVSHTALNTESSRSHSVFTIRIVQAPLDPQGAEILLDKSLIRVSQLSLVDLAGSERSVRTKNTGIKLREAGNINASLMTLRNCIELLRDSQTLDVNRKIPYRESKLTHLFKTYFEGEGKLKMVVCVNPQAEYYEETIHVMKFAEMTQDVVIARSVSAPVQVGLTPGRGKIYREALKKAKEEGVCVTDILAPVVYSLGPELPDITYLSSEGDSNYTKWIEILSMRMNKRSILTADLERKENDFRKQLLSLIAENSKLKQFEVDLEGRRQQLINLEKKLYESEREKDMLEKQLTDTQLSLEASKMQEECMKQELYEQRKENERFKIKMQERIAMEKNRLKRNMENKYKEKLSQIERKMYVKDEVFGQLREILNGEDCDYFEDCVISPKSDPPPRMLEKSVTSLELSVPEPILQKTRSATNITTGRTREPTIREAVKLFEKENMQPEQSAKSKAVANPRHRRSRSNTTEKWIEHKPIGNLDLNTVLQPAMKRKKSVSELKLKDIARADISRYVLEHQEQDSKGQLETQLYKADVIPSAFGGAQVVFNDVEKLQQMSPSRNFNARKRSSDAVPLSEIENRCAVAFESHGSSSKIMKTG